MNGFEFMTVAVMWGMGAGCGVVGLSIAAVATVCLGTLKYVTDNNYAYGEDDEDGEYIDNYFVEDNTTPVSIGPVFPEGEVVEGQVHFLQEDDHAKVFKFEIDHDGDVGSWTYQRSLAYTADDKPAVLATPIPE